MSYSGGQFSPVEAVPALPPALDPYNMMAQFDSCSAVRFDCNQGTALSPEGLRCDPLVHAPHPLHQQTYPASKGSFPLSHKVPVPEVASMDVTGYTDMFIQSPHAFTF